jgi:hypothetical protein
MKTIIENIGRCLCAIVFCAAVCLPARAWAGAEKTAASAPEITPPIVLNAAVRYESHSGDESGDDFVYSMLSASKNFPEKTVATIHFMHKKNVNDSDNDSVVLGVTFVKIVADNAWITAGYSEEKEEFADDVQLDDEALKASICGVIDRTDVSKHTVEIGYSSVKGDFKRTAPTFHNSVL